MTTAALRREYPATYGIQHEMIRNWMTQILEWQLQGKITPVVDRSFAFAEAAAAHRHIEGRGNIGKVIARAVIPGVASG
jgi:NADPH:quinone reductase-like Zn-dependent oxidoreductase